MSKGKLQIIPIGGLGEFGMNCMAIRWDEDIFVIDAGLMFPESDLLGVDIVEDVIHKAEPTGSNAEANPLVIPAGAVVVPGSRAVTRGRAAEWGLSLYAPVIVKCRDDKTDLSAALEDLLR